MNQSFVCARHSGASFFRFVRCLPLLLWLGLPTAHALAPIPFSAEVKIDADGRLQVTGPVTAPLDEAGRAKLANALTRWRFMPAKRDGRQVSATTTVFGEWSNQGNSEPRYLRHGPKPILSLPPRRPSGPNGLSLETRTIVEVQVAPDGQVANTRILAVASYPDQRDQALLMAAAAEESVRHWNFQPERIDGEAVSSTIIVPVGFRRRAGMPEQHWTVHLGGAEHFEREFLAVNTRSNPDRPEFIGGAATTRP